MTKRISSKGFWARAREGGLLMLLLLPLLNGCGTGGSSSAPVTTTAKLESIAISPSGKVIVAGREQQFSALGTFSDGSVVDISNTVFWNSTDPKVGEILNTGKFNRLSLGTTSVTATLHDVVSNAVTVLIDITIKEVVVYPLKVEVSAKEKDVTLLTVKETVDTPVQFSAKVKYSDDTEEDLLPGINIVTWTAVDPVSGNPSNMGTIDGNGLFTISNHGTAEIKAVYQGVENNNSPAVTVTVDPYIQTLTMSPIGVVPLFLNEEKQFVIRGNYTDGTSPDVSSKVTYSSTDPTVGDFNDSGVFKVALDAVRGNASTFVTASIRDREDKSIIKVITPDSAQSEPDVQVAVDVKMTFIPEGSFFAGAFAGGSDLNTSGLQNTYSYELPRHEAYISSFYIDTFEVTVDEYAEFLNAMEASDNGNWQSAMANTTNCGISRSGSAGSYSYSVLTDSIMGYKGNFPVTYINWNRAFNYAQWAGKRLPSEHEWEKAARGIQLAYRRYPWTDKGNIINPRSDFQIANYNQNFEDLNFTPHLNSVAYRLSPVGWFNGVNTLQISGTLFTTRDGRSPYGVFDMAGSVWEWVQDNYASTYYTEIYNLCKNGPGSSGTSEHVRLGVQSCDLNGLPIDPVGPSVGTQVVLKGGSYLSTATEMGGLTDGQPRIARRLIIGNKTSFGPQSGPGTGLRTAKSVQ